MFSTKRIFLATVSAVSAAFLLAGCAPNDGVNVIPQIKSEGTLAIEYKSLTQLADKANAIVIAVPTGKEFVVPLPVG